MKKVIEVIPSMIYITINISDDPHITEIQICNTKKVWDVGLFTAASKKPDIVVIGNSRGFSLL